jgi:glycosyltransferase involved in cell wall biosynthesis
VLAPPWPIPAPKYGGVESVIDGLCRGLAALGHEVHLWGTTDSTCPVSRSAIIASTDADSVGWQPVEIRHVIAGYAWLAGRQVDVIHDHSLIGPLAGPGRAGVPIATTNHLPFTSLDMAALYRDICDKVAVIAISAAQAEGAVGIRVAAVIHHGTNVATTPIGRGQGDAVGPYVAFLGRMSRDKGVHEAAVACRVAGLRLVIAARMAERSECDYYRETIEPLLGDSVTYIGELDRPAKLDFVGRASALINPVCWPEPFGLVMIEALACGTPVIALRNGAVPEIVDQGITGAICNDVAELATALGRIACFDRLACRRVAETRFSIERMAADHVALYRRLIAQRRLGPG